MPCAPFPKNPLRATFKMALLVVRIRAQKDPCVHPFHKRPLHASVFRVTKNQHLDPNILHFDFWYRGFKVVIGFHYPSLMYEGAYNRPIFHAT